MFNKGGDEVEKCCGHGAMKRLLSKPRRENDMRASNDYEYAKFARQSSIVEHYVVIFLIIIPHLEWIGDRW